MEAIMVIVTLLLILLLLGIPILLIWLVINLFRKVPVKKQLRGIGICVAGSILCTIINLSLVSSLPTPEEQAERQQRKEQLQAEKQEQAEVQAL